MSHFSIGYQPEEGNGHMFTVAFNNQPKTRSVIKKQADYKRLIRTYLQLVSWIAAVPARGLMK